MTGGPAAANGAHPHHHPHALGNKKTPSFMGFGKVAPAGAKNIDKIKQKSSRNLLAEEFHYKPKVSQSFLQDWLDYPVDRHVHAFYNSFVMWMVWLQWTNKGMAGLDPLDNTIRARVCNQLQVLGTAASLFLVIAVASFLVPPEPRTHDDTMWLNIFGCLMFTASVSLILYIALALTAIYPLIESLRDDIAFDAFENYQRHLGGKETYLFFAGMMLVLVALLVGARILYADIALYTMIGITIVICAFAQYLCRLIFLSLDPISSMHLGLSNNPEEHYRAELLSHFILRKIPNTLIVDDETGKEFFERKRESAKLETTRASQKLGPKRSVHSAYSTNTSAYQSQYSAHSTHTTHHSAHPRGSDDDDDIGFGGGSVDTTNTLGRDKPNGSLDLYHRSISEERNEDDMTVTDLEGTVVPFAVPSKFSGKSKPPPLLRQKTRAEVVEAARVEVVHKFASPTGPLPSLQDMFCHPEKYVFRSAGLSLVDSVSVYAYITQVGCNTTEHFMHFLKESKQYRPCTCSRDNNGDAGSAAHADQCSSRRAIVWTEALTGMGIPNYHAVLVIKALRPHL